MKQSQLDFAIQAKWINRLSRVEGYGNIMCPQSLFGVSKNFIAQTNWASHKPLTKKCKDDHLCHLLAAERKHFQSLAIICRKPHVASSICLRAKIFQNPEGTLWTHGIMSYVRRKLTSNGVKYSLGSWERGHRVTAKNLTVFTFLNTILIFILLLRKYTIIINQIVHYRKQKTHPLILFTTYVNLYRAWVFTSVVMKCSVLWDVKPYNWLTSPSICGTRRFIIMFTTVLHWSLSWETLIQSVPPHPI
jgi:hypothetical protein